MSLLFNPYFLAGLTVLFAGFALALIFLPQSSDSHASQTTKVLPHDSPSRKIAKIGLLVLSIIAAVVAVAAFFRNFSEISKNYSMELQFGIVGIANAETATIPPIVTSVVPYILVAVFMIMIAAFAVAVLALLWLPSTPENEKRVNAADNIVKTFGGFFIGFATSLLNMK